MTAPFTRRLRLLLAVLILAAATVVVVPTTAMADTPSVAAVPAVPCNKLPEKLRGLCGGAVGAASALLPVLVAGGGAVSTQQTVALVKRVSGVMSKLDAATNPEVWAKESARSAGSLLATIQSQVLAAPPNLLNGDYLVMYEVCWGFGVVVAAFAMIWAAAAATGTKAEAIALKKEAAARGLGFMPVMTVLPAVLTVAWAASFELARWFGTDAQTKSQPLLDTWFEVTTAMSSFIGFPGVALGAFMVFGLTALAGFVAWLETAVAVWGGFVIPLFVPVLFALSINPRWKRPLQLVGVAVAATLLTPVLIFFSFWAMWNLAHMSIQPGGATGMSAVTLVLIGVLAAAAVPVVLPFMLSVLSPAGGHGLAGLGAAGRGAARAPGRAAVRGYQMARMSGFTSGGGGWSGGGRSQQRRRGRGDSDGEDKPAAKKDPTPKPNPKPKPDPTPRPDQKPSVNPTPRPAPSTRDAGTAAAGGAGSGTAGGTGRTGAAWSTSTRPTEGRRPGGGAGGGGPRREVRPARPGEGTA